MNLTLEDNVPCVEEMLQIILNKSDLVVKTARTQKMFQGFKRSIYLDIYAEDSKGVIYNIEIQQADEGADPRRARFHNGMIDVHSLKAGQDFHGLPECYVIFVTLNDVLGLSKTIIIFRKCLIFPLLSHLMRSGYSASLLSDSILAIWARLTSSNAIKPFLYSLSSHAYP